MPHEYNEPSIVIGTAGHIDHGKSTLVQALTGTDPDRLVEEKRRGITIELGFARLDLPGGASVGIVDVPRPREVRAPDDRRSHRHRCRHFGRGG